MHGLIRSFQLLAAFWITVSTVYAATRAIQAARKTAFGHFGLALECVAAALYAIALATLWGALL